MPSAQPLIDTGLVTYRQLDLWVRRGYLKPANTTPGSGFRRDWSDGELLVAARMGRLVRAGLEVDVAANVARHAWPTLGLGPGITIDIREVA